MGVGLFHQNHIMRDACTKGLKVLVLPEEERGESIL
jgi:hypothetical protein